MRVELALGRTRIGVDVDLPAAQVLQLEKADGPPLADPAAALRAALAQPTAGPALSELARGRRDAVIVVSDHTRPVPNALLLPPLLEELARVGIPQGRIRVLVATGLHRPSTRDELDAMFGAELRRSLRIEQHAAREPGAHVDLGHTREGMPVRIDRRYVDSELKLLTGLIEPHLMAGFSGGRKAVCPGLAAEETIRWAHAPELLEGAIGPGLVDGNPLHRSLLEAQALAGADFLLNVTLDRARRIRGIFSGDPLAAHAAGMRAADADSRVTLAEPVDLALVSGGGHPLDATFYQAIKGIASALGIVREGGAIVLCAQLDQGCGSEPFRARLASVRSATELEARLFDPAHFAIDQWMLQHLCQALRRVRVWVCSPQLPAELAGSPLVRCAADPHAALAAELPRLGAAARIAVLPEGPYLMPCLARGPAPLGAGRGFAHASA